MLIRIIALHLLRVWATLRGNDLAALKLLERIAMLDFSKLEAAVTALMNKDNADEAASAAAAAALSDAQMHIDALTHNLTAGAAATPSPAPAPAPAPVPVPAPVATEPAPVQPPVQTI